MAIQCRIMRVFMDAILDMALPLRQANTMTKSTTPIAFGGHLTTEEEDDNSVRLREAVIIGGPATLRSVAAFLTWCADQIDSGNEQDHYHWGGDGTPQAPELVVVTDAAVRERYEDIAFHDKSKAEAYKEENAQFFS